MPVHTVGVGAESVPDDLELEDVQVTPVGLPGSTVSAQVSIRHSGASLAQLKVYDGDAILASEAIQLPASTGVTTRWVDIDVGKAGVRDLKFALDALPGETNTINNARLRPMEVPEQRRHILYIEGEPRWEYKFIRRSLEEGFAVRVASLLKTTPNKFYRQGVESPDELTDGFPTDELEAVRLRRADDRQLRGRRAHARAARHDPRVREPARRQPDDDGRPARPRRRRLGATSVAEALPAALPMLDGPSFERIPQGDAHAARPHVRAHSARGGRAEGTSRSGTELPDLADFQHIADTKPGAEVLLEAQINGRNEPLLVHERYGLGNSYILATGGTWRWQMQLPHEDQRHETFWRQLLQALATSAPQPVTLTSKQVFYGDESEVTLRADVRDKKFQPAADATVSLSVSDGSGPPSTLEMTPVAGERGVYQATYETTHTGIFRFEAAAKSGRRRSRERALRGAPRGRRLEHYHTQQNRALLERLAAATGGNYFTLGDVGKLPEAVSFSDAGQRRTHGARPLEHADHLPRAAAAQSRRVAAPSLLGAAVSPNASANSFRPVQAISAARAKGVPRGTPRHHPWGSAAHIPVRRGPRETPFARTAEIASRFARLFALAPVRVPELLWVRRAIRSTLVRGAAALRGADSNSPSRGLRPRFQPRASSRGVRAEASTRPCTWMCHRASPRAKAPAREPAQPASCVARRNAAAPCTSDHQVGGLRRMLASLALAASVAVPAAAHAELYFLIVGGLGGEPKYQEQFDKQIKELTAVARRTTGDARVTVLTGEGATREALEKSLGSLKTRAKSGRHARA